MALRLHGDLLSNNTKRVAAALEELEVLNFSHDRIPSPTQAKCLWLLDDVEAYRVALFGLIIPLMQKHEVPHASEASH
jgi:hypothetical protein